MRQNFTRNISKLLKYWTKQNDANHEAWTPNRTLLLYFLVFFSLSVERHLFLGNIPLNFKWIESLLGLAWTIRDSSFQCFEVNGFYANEKPAATRTTKREWKAAGAGKNRCVRELNANIGRQQLCNDNVMLMYGEWKSYEVQRDVHIIQTFQEWVNDGWCSDEITQPFLLFRVFVSRFECWMDSFKDED